MTDGNLVRGLGSQAGWRRFRRSRAGWCGLAIVALFVAAAALADVIAPFPPQELVAEPFLPPSTAHWLGTDGLGRDLASRVLYGSRLSLAAGLAAVSLAVGVGGALGAVAGYWGGPLDQAVMRLMDVILSFPGVLVALGVVVAWGRGPGAVIVAVGLVNVPLVCRQVRAAALGLRGHDYVAAARAAGASHSHIVLRTILPGLGNTLVVLGTLTLGTAILEVAGLAFLGVAGEIDVAEWGSMLSTAKQTLRSSVWPALAPGAAISLAVIGFNLLGDGLRDALDVRGSR